MFRAAGVALTALLFSSTGLAFINGSDIAQNTTRQFPRQFALELDSQPYFCELDRGLPQVFTANGQGQIRAFIAASPVALSNSPYDLPRQFMIDAFNSRYFCEKDTSVRVTNLRFIATQTTYQGVTLTLLGNRFSCTNESRSTTFRSTNNTAFLAFAPLWGATDQVPRQFTVDYRGRRLLCEGNGLPQNPGSGGNGTITRQQLEQLLNSSCGYHSGCFTAATRAYNSNRSLPAVIDAGCWDFTQKWLNPEWERSARCYRTALSLARPYLDAGVQESLVGTCQNFTTRWDQEAQCFHSSIQRSYPY